MAKKFNLANREVGDRVTLANGAVAEVVQNKMLKIISGPKKAKRTQTGGAKGPVMKHRCNSLQAANCKNDPTCVYTKGYKTKKGKNVKGACRRSPAKGAARLPYGSRGTWLALGGGSNKRMQHAGGLSPRARAAFRKYWLNRLGK